VRKAKTTATADPLRGWQARKATTTKTTVLRGSGSDSGADEVWMENKLNLLGEDGLY
jgi:hypothetical protein